MTTPESILSRDEILYAQSDPASLLDDGPVIAWGRGVARAQRGHTLSRVLALLRKEHMHWSAWEVEQAVKRGEV